MPILTVARAMPIVLTEQVHPVLLCGGGYARRAERIFDLAALARRIASGIGLPFGLFRDGRGIESRFSP